MKSVIATLFAFLTTAAAFAPVNKPAMISSALSMSKDAAKTSMPNAAALAAFATAVAPMAANAEELDTSVVAGFGIGLVACVVFFAVGFSVGYGTLIKP